MIDRKTLLLCLALSSLGATGCGVGVDRPNVLIVVMDTVRGDRCSVDGYGRPTTPRLLAVAREGTTFRDAWSPAGWTGPAHASLFTGLRPEHHGYLLGNRAFLEEGAVTLAERLSGAGYRTACFSNNTLVGRGFGLAQGFATVETIEDQKDPRFPTARWAHRRALEAASAASRDSVPFFVFVNDMEAHLPYDPLDEYGREFVAPGTPADLLARGRAFTPWKAVARILARRTPPPDLLSVMGDLYDACVRTVDEEVGKLVRGLSDLGLLDDTILIVTSDHGENLGDHGLLSHKMSLHRSICHVPLVIRFPGLFAGGRIVNEVVRLEDVYPTILELCGLAVPEGLDGKSLLRDLPGRLARAEHGRPSREFFQVYVHHPVPDEDTALFAVSLRSVYDGRYHLIRYSDGRRELYDVSRDPAEKVNLSQRRPALRERLERLLGAEDR